MRSTDTTDTCDEPVLPTSVGCEMKCEHKDTGLILNFELRIYPTVLAGLLRRDSHCVSTTRIPLFFPK